MCAGRFITLLSLGLLGTIAVASTANAAKPQQQQQHEDAAKVDTSNAPFRAKLVSNAAIAQRAATTFSSAAKQPAPPKLPNDQRKIYVEHSKWLADGATRLGALHTQMDVVLAKGSRAPATELAQMNMQFLTLCEAIENESRRFTDLTNAARARHATAMSTIRSK